jgi:hypothetical protein
MRQDKGQLAGAKDVQYLQNKSLLMGNIPSVCLSAGQVTVDAWIRPKKWS